MIVGKHSGRRLAILMLGLLLIPSLAFLGGIVVFLGWQLYSAFDQGVAEGASLVALTSVVGGVALYMGIGMALNYYRKVSSMFLEDYRQRHRSGGTGNQAPPPEGASDGH